MIFLLDKDERRKIPSRPGRIRRVQTIEQQTVFQTSERYLCDTKNPFQSTIGTLFEIDFVQWKFPGDSYLRHGFRSSTDDQFSVAIPIENQLSAADEHRQCRGDGSSDAVVGRSSADQ